MRLTVFRLLLLVAVAAILVHIVTNPARKRAREHYERCMQIAGTHASMAAEYRRNAQSVTILKIAAWHERMSKDFEQAARQPWAALPQSQPFSPQD